MNISINQFKIHNATSFIGIIASVITQGHFSLSVERKTGGGKYTLRERAILKETYNFDTNKKRWHNTIKKPNKDEWRKLKVVYNKPIKPKKPNNQPGLFDFFST